MEIKIPLYNLLNCFLTGFVFLGALIVISPKALLCLLSDETLRCIKPLPEIIITATGLAIIYETGVIINRLGSVVTETILRFLHIIKFNDNYILFNIKKKEFPVLNILSREYAISRTGITMFLIFFVLFCLQKNCVLAIASLLVVSIFTVSCVKHSNKIVSLMSS